MSERAAWWRWRRGWIVGASVALVLIAAVAVGETLGWPFLAAPLQSLLTKKLDRTVRFSTSAAPAAPAASDASSAPAATPTTAFAVRFIGGVWLRAAQLEVAAPAWSQAPHLLLAQDVTLQLRYIDLWRAWRGQRLRIDSLKARQLDAHLERLADGRASWVLATPDRAAAAPPLPPPSLGQLRVGQGSVRFSDAVSDVDVVANLSLVEVRRASAVLRADASGRYGEFPVQVELSASGGLPWEADNGANPNAVLKLKATVGRANLAFDGSAGDVVRLRGLSGRFSLSGPSLAAVGDPVGVTLPSTAAFRSRGTVVRQGDTWRVVLDDVTIGASQLNGAFSYDRSGAVPLLAGRLGGKRLALADLGPVVGLAPPANAGNAGNTGKAKPGAKPGVQPTVKAAGKAARKVLPNRPFDLASLRKMDANVLIDIEELDLNTPKLEPLRPLRTHLRLASGVLSLNNIEAHTADGRVFGAVKLDGRANTALWDADLRWSAVRLERWIRQTRGNAAPPFVSGRLDGAAKLQGQGRSTAEILSSLKGGVHTELRAGTVSHLVIEAAGLDLAQGLGVLIKGDDALAVPCAVAELVASGGVLRPRLMVLDTTDSVVWIDGSLSLASETLDLRAVVAPKDFSPLALRTPLRVHGSFANPEVSLQKDALVRKLGVSFLLSLLNPLAALIPLIDAGDTSAAAKGAADCQNLRQRAQVKTAAAGATVVKARSPRK